MRDFERIEVLMKDADRLDTAIINESKRLKEMSLIEKENERWASAHFLITLASSLQNIILEKWGIHTKEQLDKEMMDIMRNKD